MVMPLTTTMRRPLRKPNLAVSRSDAQPPIGVITIQAIHMSVV